MNLDRFKEFRDERGWLLPFDFSKLPFTPKRIFFVSNVPQGMRRGDHAHYKTQQYIICLSGSVNVGLIDAHGNLEEKTITQGQSVFVDKLIWDYQDFLTGHDSIAVLCSTEYDPDDYITSMETLVQFVYAGI